VSRWNDVATKPNGVSIFIANNGTSSSSNLTQWTSSGAVRGVAIHYDADDDCFLAIGDNGIFRSTNDGTSWQSVKTLAARGIGIVSDNMGRWIATWERSVPPGGNNSSATYDIAYSEDRGDTWIVVTSAKALQQTPRIDGFTNQIVNFANGRFLFCGGTSRPMGTLAANYDGAAQPAFAPGSNNGSAIPGFVTPSTIDPASNGVWKFQHTIETSRVTGLANPTDGTDAVNLGSLNSTIATTVSGISTTVSGPITGGVTGGTGNIGLDEGFAKYSGNVTTIGSPTNVGTEIRSGGSVGVSLLPGNDIVRLPSSRIEFGAAPTAVFTINLSNDSSVGINNYDQSKNLRTIASSPSQDGIFFSSSLSKTNWYDVGEEHHFRVNQVAVAKIKAGVLAVEQGARLSVGGSPSSNFAINLTNSESVGTRNFDNSKNLRMISSSPSQDGLFFGDNASSNNWYDTAGEHQLRVGQIPVAKVAAGELIVVSSSKLKFGESASTSTAGDINGDNTFSIANGDLDWYIARSNLGTLLLGDTRTPTYVAGSSFQVRLDGATSNITVTNNATRLDQQLLLEAAKGAVSSDGNATIRSHDTFRISARKGVINQRVIEVFQGEVRVGDNETDSISLRGDNVLMYTNGFSRNIFSEDGQLHTNQAEPSTPPVSGIVEFSENNVLKVKDQHVTEHVSTEHTNASTNSVLQRVIKDWTVASSSAVAFNDIIEIELAANQTIHGTLTFSAREVTVARFRSTTFSFLISKRSTGVISPLTGVVSTYGSGPSEALDIGLTLQVTAPNPSVCRFSVTINPAENAENLHCFARCEATLVSTP
jgi:hypothetical protein